MKVSLVKTERHHSAITWAKQTQIGETILLKIQSNHVKQNVLNPIPPPFPY